LIKGIGAWIKFNRNFPIIWVWPVVHKLLEYLIELILKCLSCIFKFRVFKFVVFSNKSNLTLTLNYWSRLKILFVSLIFIKNVLNFFERWFFCQCNFFCYNTINIIVCNFTISDTRITKNWLSECSRCNMLLSNSLLLGQSTLSWNIIWINWRNGFR